jgi:PAS domain S-box-containing protein
MTPASRHSIEPDGRNAKSLRLSLLIAVSIVILGVFSGLYVQRNLNAISHGLPVTLDRQGRQMTLVVGDFSDLLREVQLARVDPSPERVSKIEALLDHVEHHLKDMRDTYDLDNLIGASRMHALAEPAVIDLRRWLDEGIYSYGPHSPLTLSLMELRIREVYRRARKVLTDAQERTGALLEEQSVAMQALHDVVYPLLLILMILIASIVLVTLRQLRAGSALAASERRYQSLIEALPVGLYRIDRKGRITFANQVCQVYFGTPLQDLVGKIIYDFHARSLAWQIAEDDAAVFSSGRAITKVEHQVLTGLPEGADMEMVKLPVRDALGRVEELQAIFWDVTERQRSAEALRQTKEAAERASRMKSEFLANISHELRTPLNSVIGFSSLLVEEIYGPLGDDRYRGYATDIQTSGQHLLDLINDILDLSKIEAGELKLEEHEVDLVDVIETCHRMVRKRAERANVNIRVDLPAVVPALFADERQLRQIFLNLLTNGVKFTQPGGKVVVGLRVLPDHRLEISVADTGVGIPQSELDNVMQPFVQVASAHTRDHEGTGLGLPLVKSMAQMHGAEFHLESTPGSGTTATILFPANRVMDRGTAPGRLSTQAATR